jgi:NADH:ubiquinone reductase (H+-translocating)
MRFRIFRGDATQPFCFRARGTLASIGHRNAVATIYGFKVSGFVAWFLWRGIYLAKLPTLSRKLEVAMNWACSIPFPPNIVQLRLSTRQSQKTQITPSEENFTKVKETHEYQSCR